MSQRPPAAALRESQLLFAYRRVTELLAICRSASKSHGAEDDRAEQVRAETHCGLDDARWAVWRENGGSPSHRLEDALRKAHQEGYEIPPGRTGPEAFLRLRNFLERHGLFRPNNRGRRGKGPSSNRAV